MWGSVCSFKHSSVFLIYRCSTAPFLLSHKSYFLVLSPLKLEKTVVVYLYSGFRAGADTPQRLVFCWSDGTFGWMRGTLEFYLVFALSLSPLPI
jgi:hypothetical protein